MPENPTPDGRSDVLICGAGPNGLMLAIELSLAGARPLVIDRLPEPSSEPRANALVGQVVRFLDMRGLYAELSGLPGPPRPVPAYIFSGLPLRLSDLPDNPLLGIPIPQPVLVRKLYARAEQLGVTVRWGHELTDLQAYETGVRATIEGPSGRYDLDTRFLVGADGGRSVVRKRAGIDFPGHTSTAITRLAHVSVPAELRTDDGGIQVPGVGRFAFGHNRLERGMFVFAELEPGRPIVGVTEFGADPAGDSASDSVGDEPPMTLDELRVAARRVLGTDLPFGPPTGPGPHALRRISGQNTRLASRYRDGRILLVGDAAHVHAGIGGPGLNLGLQDAANLGWKLAAELAGLAPADLLDTYEIERRPVGERVMTSTLAQTALMLPGPEIGSLRRLVGELLDEPAVTASIANLMAGSDVRYDVGDEHPLSGRMVPDSAVRIDGEARRVAELMHDGRPLVLDLGAGEKLGAIAGEWTDRIRVVRAESSERPETAILVRPDGYVAWATDDPAAVGSWAGGPGLRDALGRWFGAPLRARTPA